MQAHAQPFQEYPTAVCQRSAETEAVDSDAVVRNTVEVVRSCELEAGSETVAGLVAALATRCQ